MANTNMYSPNEQDYIRRVAGKVPADVMASIIGRTRNSLVNRDYLRSGYLHHRLPVMGG